MNLMMPQQFSLLVVESYYGTTGETTVEMLTSNSKGIVIVGLGLIRRTLKFLLYYLDPQIGLYL